MTVRHILQALEVLDEALDQGGEITIEAMGRIDFLIGHPELTNPFRSEKNKEAWNRGWQEEYERWMNGTNNNKRRSSTEDSTRAESDEDSDTD